MTYGFKSDGRRRDPQPLEPKGQELLPGAYSVQDSFDECVAALRVVSDVRGETFAECLGDDSPMDSKVPSVKNR